MGDLFDTNTEFCKAYISDRHPAMTGKTAKYTTIDEFATLQCTPQRGDRVRIKEGYEGAGDVCYFIAKSATKNNRVLVDVTDSLGEVNHQECLLADAIEPYPYTREERIERAIEDIYEAAGWGSPGVQENADKNDADYRALLFAILEAGV